VAAIQFSRDVDHGHYYPLTFFLRKVTDL